MVECIRVRGLVIPVDERTVRTVGQGELEREDTAASWRGDGLEMEMRWLCR